LHASEGVAGASGGTVTDWAALSLPQLLAGAQVLALLAFGRQRGASPGPAGTGRPSMRAGLVEFFRELGANRPLLILFGVTAAVEVFAFSFLTVLPDLAVDRLGLDASGLGLLHAARSTGGIIGGVVMAMAGPSRRLGVVWLAMIAAFGLEVMALGLAPNLPIAFVVTVTIAFCAVASDVLTQSMMQLAVPDALRGRAMGAWQVAVGFSPIGHLQMGLLAGAIGTAGALLLNGAALVLVAIGAGAASRRLREM